MFRKIKMGGGVWLCVVVKQGPHSFGGKLKFEASICFSWNTEGELRERGNRKEESNEAGRRKSGISAGAAALCIPTPKSSVLRRIFRVDVEFCCFFGKLI